MTITEFLAARYAEEWSAARDRELAAGLDESRETRDIDAKRKILTLADRATNMDLQHDQEFRVEERDEDAEPYLGDEMLRVLAAVYSDHPDYDESWRPCDHPDYDPAWRP